MGTVYDAVDRERDARVALKTLSVPNLASSARLKSEFRAVADLAHPNPAPDYELACVNGRPRGRRDPRELLGRALLALRRVARALDFDRKPLLETSSEDFPPGVPIDADALPERIWLRPFYA